MPEKEETRKIQFTGKSSYIVSLPKKWVTDLGLKRGDQVRMARQGAGALQLYPPRLRAEGPKKEDATIEIGADEETASTVRKLISLYFLGYGTIHVRPRSRRLGPGQRTAVKHAVKRMLMGAEIIEDSGGGMTVRVMVQQRELTVDGAFKRMIHLAKLMLADAVRAAGEGDRDLAREVISTDDEVDRFGFYIIRQLKTAIENEHMLKEMGLGSARSCLGYRLVVKNIERTGDHAALIAQDLLECGRGFGGEVRGRIGEMCSFSVSVLDDACLAMFKGDYAQAEETIRRAAGVSGYERAVVEASNRLGDPLEVYRVRRTTEGVRRIAEYASDIAEIVLNMTIEKALKKG